MTDSMHIHPASPDRFQTHAQRCTGWVWCNWCEGAPGGCEFCDGARKRGCPCKVGDLDGNRWDMVGLALAGTDGICAAGTGGCGGGEITAGQSIWTRADDLSKVAHLECVIPAYGAAPSV